MTAPMALAWGVADRESKEKAARNPRVPASYGKMLIDRGRAHNLSRKELAKRAKISDQTAWRVETGNPDGSVKAAYKMRAVLIALGEDIPPVPVGTDEWSLPAPRTPAPTIPKLRDEAEAIRANIVRARTAMGYGLHDVSDFTGIPLDTLRAYELGEEMISGLHLKALAKLYARTMDDVTEPTMPLPEPASRQVIHMRTDPDAIEVLSAAEREQLERLKHEAAALNAAARKRMEQGPRKRR